MDHLPTKINFQVRKLLVSGREKTSPLLRQTCIKKITTNPTTFPQWKGSFSLELSLLLVRRYALRTPRSREFLGEKQIKEYSDCSFMVPGGERLSFSLGSGDSHFKRLKLFFFPPFGGERKFPLKFPEFCGC